MDCNFISINRFSNNDSFPYFCYMRGLRNIVDFYINSSLHVALAVVALTWVTFLEFNVEVDITILAFNLFATVTGYNFVKYFGLAKFHHRSLATWLKVIQVFSAICFLGLAYFTLKLSFEVLIFYIIFGVITFLYAIPFIPRKYFLDSEKNLRSISGLKVYVIASVWVAATVIVPLITTDFLVNRNVVLKSIQIFIIVLVWMLPFEIRDLRYDSIKLSTIPQIIGIKATKFLGALLIAIFFTLEFFKELLETKYVIVVGIIALTTLLLLWAAKQNQNKYYSGFWVESIPILWLILLMIF